MTDQFGIQELFPTLAGGKEWFNNWGTAATTVTYTSSYPDLTDNWVYYHGNNGTYRIYGQDDPDNQYCMAMWGTAPRYYIEAYSDRPHGANPTGLPSIQGYGTIQNPTIIPWQSVEMTIYSKIDVPSTISYSGITLGSWTNHYSDTFNGVADYSSRTYYTVFEALNGEMLHKKENYFPNTSQFINTSYPLGGALQTGVWVGIKHICRYFDNLPQVQLDTYIDLSEGGRNGTQVWNHVLSNTDFDGLLNVAGTGDAQQTTSQDPQGTPGSFWTGKVIKPGYHSTCQRLLLRNDGITNLPIGQYFKWYSIREIDSLHQYPGPVPQYNISRKILLP